MPWPPGFEPRRAPCRPSSSVGQSSCLVNSRPSVRIRPRALHRRHPAAPPAHRRGAGHRPRSQHQAGLTQPPRRHDHPQPGLPVPALRRPHRLGPRPPPAALEPRRGHRPRQPRRALRHPPRCGAPRRLEPPPRTRRHPRVHPTRRHHPHQPPTHQPPCRCTTPTRAISFRSSPTPRPRTLTLRARARARARAPARALGPAILSRPRSNPPPSRRPSPNPLTSRRRAWSGPEPSTSSAFTDDPPHRRPRICSNGSKPDDPHDGRRRQ